MDTPKRHVSWLESFPPDIWAYLVVYIHGDQIFRLIMTGATLVAKRLKSPTVVKSIKLGGDFLIFKSSPRLLNEFPSLTELCIITRGYEWSPRSGLTLDQIPTGVRKLKLVGDCKNSVLILFGEPGPALDLYKHHHLESLNLYALKLQSFYWMTKSPQTLTRLSLSRWDSEFVNLPASLIHFRCAAVFLDPYMKLPPSLQSWKSLYTHGVDLLLSLLPHSTSKISVGGSVFYDKSTSLLPIIKRLSNLTTFQVMCTTTLNFETNSELVPALPSTLTTLATRSCIPCSAWPLLPQTLTKLRFSAPDWSTEADPTSNTTNSAPGTQWEVQPIPFDCLPRSITELQLDAASKAKRFCPSPANFKGKSYFPPHLAYLKIPTIQISPGMAKLLPSSLTYLDIGNLHEQVCEHLPCSIRTLIAYKTLLSPNLIKFLPKSLTVLELITYTDGDQWFDYHTGHQTHSDSLLLDFSKQKKCLSNWKGLASLPATLTHLLLRNAEELKNSFLLHQPMPNLLKLDLHISKHFTDPSIRRLSPHLTELNMHNSSKISGKSFKFLPRCLISLDLSSSESIHDPDIQHLPRTLTAANLDHAIHLSDLCISDLPPHMANLSMRFNEQITPSSYDRFPYPIRSSEYSEIFPQARIGSWAISRGEVNLKPSY